MKPAFPTIATALVTQIFNNYAPGSYGGDGRHKGIDYGVSTNNPIYACMDGVIETAMNMQTGYGRHIRVRHTDGSLSIYGHLNQILLPVGAQVIAGQEIGKSGGDKQDNVDGDGFSTGAHLHWEIRPPGVTTDQGAVDPHKYCLQYLPMRYEVAECSAAVGLNVRSAPMTSAPVIWTLKRREVVHIVEKQNGWGRIHALRPEWCSLSYLQFTGVVVDPKPEEPQPPAEVTDEEKLKRLWDAHPELH